MILLFQYHYLPFLVYIYGTNPDTPNTSLMKWILGPLPAPYDAQKRRIGEGLKLSHNYVRLQRNVAV